jgi:hypothetical protein
MELNSSLNVHSMRNVIATALFVSLAAFFVPGTAAAQGRELSSQARQAQYVFVVDDSGSMRLNVDGMPPADPDRLAVFAVRSTLSMLDPSDEATIVRLNDAASAPAIGPLASNRNTLERMLKLDGTIASYKGKNTFCRRALDAVKAKLNDAHRPGVSQVVMFLTDGRCEDSPSVTRFLDGLRSHEEDGMFSFYLIRFKGRAFSSELKNLAEETGGSDIEASADNPASILEPFAQALARSQGYDAELKQPGNTRLKAHRGARRVRLLAVAPGAGPKLAFDLKPAAKGENIKRVGGTRAGIHQYDDGRIFRFAALDYRPGTVPVDVKVKNGGGRWKVVAVPEYRLQAMLTIHRGSCEANGPKVQMVEGGETVCVRVRLVNENGELVEADLASGASEAKVAYLPPGTKQPTNLFAEREGSAASFTLPRPRLEEGSYSFRPMVGVAVPGGQGDRVMITGARKTLEVSNVNIDFVPARVDFGNVVPGDQKFKKVRIDSNEKPVPAKLVVPDRDGVPGCVTFELGGKGEGETLTITGGQEYQLGLKIHPFCGPKSVKRALEQGVELQFQGPLTGQSRVLAVAMNLDSQIKVPDELSVELTGGESRDVPLEITGNFSRPLELHAMLMAHDERRDWPDDEDHLLLEFLDREGDPMLEDGLPALLTAATYDPQGVGQPVRLRVESNACCTASNYNTKVLLKAPGVDPVAIPLKVRVKQASAWECWGPTVLMGVAAGLLLLLLGYLVNIFRKSHFLSKKKLVANITLMEWYGSYPEPSDRSEREVKKMVDKRFGLGARFGAWVRSNPLKIGLPGQPVYRETVCLALNEAPPYAWVKVADPEVLEKLSERPNPVPHIYMQSGGTVAFVLDSEGLVGGVLKPTEGMLEYEELVELRSVVLEVDGDDREDGEWAGWKVG